MRRFMYRALAAWLGGLLVTLTLATAAGAQSGAAAAVPDVRFAARSALLMEFSTGKVLLSQDADTVIAPASLTKLMTLYLAFSAIQADKMRLEDPVTVSRRAWAQNPELADSSLMFLEPGQRVTVGEILKGIAISSGNDACIAIAEHMAGSVEAFVNLMNQQARSMGLLVTTFMDPHGLSDQSRTTAGEMAVLAREYIQKFPAALPSLHAVESFAYPQPHNLTDTQKANPDRARTITQLNRNPLLGQLEGADGLKTGFVDAAGYHLVGTAAQGDMRLIGVLMGTESEAVRVEQGMVLLRYGFTNFEVTTVLKGDEVLKTIPVYKGNVSEVPVVPRQPLRAVLRRGSEVRLHTDVRPVDYVVAPVAKDQAVGTVVVTLDDQQVAATDLVPQTEVKPGGFFRRLWDTLRLFLGRILGGTK